MLPPVAIESKASDFHALSELISHLLEVSVMLYWFLDFWNQ